ncbi:MAG: hypothetical protein WDN31_05295 [Hyphomicrobium sp.]
MFRDSVTDARARRDEARRAMIADLTGGQSLNDEARTRAGQVYMDSLPAAPPPSSAVLARNEAYAGMVRSLDEEVASMSAYGPAASRPAGCAIPSRVRRAPNTARCLALLKEQQMVLRRR